MAFITRKITRTSQPQELVGIDWSAAGAQKLTWLSGTVPHGAVFGAVASNGAAKTYLANLVDGSRANVYDTNNGFVSVATPHGMAGENKTGNTPNGLNYISGNGLLHGATELTLLVWFVFDAGNTSSQWLNFRSDGQHTLDVFSQTSSSITFGSDWLSAWNGASRKTLSGLVSGDLVCIGASITQTGAVLSANGRILGTKSGGVFTISTAAKTTFIASRTQAKYLGSAAFVTSMPDATLASYTANPWQIFEPIEETIWIPDGVSITLPTLVQPTSTTSAGIWTPVGAATLHEAIDEVTPSDADYISVAAASNCEMVLAESAFPTGNVSLAYRALSSTGNTLTVTLKQGTTTIMTRTHALTGTATLYTQPLTAGEVAAIVAGPVTCTLTSS